MYIYMGAYEPEHRAACAPRRLARYALVYIYVHICVCKYICTHTYRYIYLFIYIYIYTYMYIHIYTYMYIHIYTYIHICIYIYIYMCVCMQRDGRQAQEHALLPFKQRGVPLRGANPDRGWVEPVVGTTQERNLSAPPFMNLNCKALSFINLVSTKTTSRLL